METKQTAVSLIAENFNLLSDKDFKSWFLNSLDYLEQLEKNQIIDGVYAGYNYDGARLEEYSEQYYAKTYEPTEAEKVEDIYDTNDSKLDVFIRSKVDWYESNHDYQVATDTIRCWLDEFLQQQKTRNTPNQ